MEPQALHRASVKFALDLHPSATGDVMEGIRDQLNSLLLRSVLHLYSVHDQNDIGRAQSPHRLFHLCRYSAHLEGVLVSYTNPRILSQQVCKQDFCDA